MRLSDSTCLALFAGLSIVACGTAVSPPSGSNDVGGTLNPGSGGNTSASSSSSSQGGADKSTTTTQQGDPQGGEVSTGGATQATGGKVSTGGRTATSTQGVGGVATGGRVSTGGTGSGNGGTANGGNVQTGGAPVGNGGSAMSAPSGGKSATGGAGPATGGAAPTCVDTPRSSESCADAKSWGFCSQSWFTNCQVTCGTCGSSSGAGGAQGQGGTRATSSSNPTATGGATNSSTLPPVTGGQNAWASRYWDCCKPACGWTGNTSDPISSCDKSNNNIGVSDGAKNACENGGSAFMCWSGVPHSLNDSVSYGFAAASGNNYKCGQCYQIQFDGGSHNAGANPGCAAIKGKQMIIQVINNGGVESNQFDILIPGGGVGALNACSNQWGSSDLGAQYGGFLTGCNGDTGCVQNKCNTVFAGKTDLLAGCTWFLNWYKAADNPTFQYKAVNCPSDFNSVMGGLNK